jgi:L-aminopeptidase/D-esterase-like protein
MESVYILPPKMIAFIACNIGVYESVQKFGRLITSGKITNGTDVSRVAELLSESNAFYDAEMISELMNVMLQHTNNNAINRVTAGEVRNIMNQLKAVGVSIP